MCRIHDQCLGRWLQADEVSASAAFLLSDDSKFVNAQSIVVSHIRLVKDSYSWLYYSLAISLELIVLCTLVGQRDDLGPCWTCSAEEIHSTQDGVKVE